MYHVRLIGHFIRASVQQELAYRANFFINVLHTVLSLITGILGIVVLFEQVNTINGWDFASTLALLGVYLTLSALRRLFIGPSLDSLAGMDGDIWRGTLDFTLLRPVSKQFLVSVRMWESFALVDLALGVGVLAAAVIELEHTVSLTDMLIFTLTLITGVMLLYSILLIFVSLVFWSPGFMFTWVFDGIFQMARYPLDLYPGWLRLVLAWVIPVGIMTTVPAQALTGELSAAFGAGHLLLTTGLFIGASWFFRFALRRYVSASS
ncbi:MAG: ABC-2 family transporter protein [Anaerolineae bacterium]|nr:ABC-2 family transporter protein [Anaerolineae bacterium]